MRYLYAPLAIAFASCSLEGPPILNTPTNAGGMAGSSPATAGTGGGGTAGQGVGGAAAGSGGQAVTGGASGASGGSAGSGGAPTMISDDYVGDVMITVNENVNTILDVTWTQLIAADTVWLEFTFEDGNVMTSRAKPGALGAHEDVVLGVPGDTTVTIRVVSSQGGVHYKTSDHMGTTDPVPAGMPLPEVLDYDAAIASPDRWLFGAVEDSIGGCNGLACYYNSLFWLYIMDRQGRIVWYYADGATGATSSFQRIDRSGGEFIWIEKRPFSNGGNTPRTVLKMTLDHKYREEIPVQGLADCIDVTTSGSLLYDTVGQDPYLREMTFPPGMQPQTRNIWRCRDTFTDEGSCYSNTVNWNELDDTVLMSFPERDLVLEIDRLTGDVVGQYGTAMGSYAFQPNTWRFEFQHFANITNDGTLLVSSHMPGNSSTTTPVENGHGFFEFTIDRANETLIEKWYYNDGPEWAMYKGMAIRLPNGNTLANYGTGGTIREITPDKQTAFRVKFDVEQGNDFFNKMVGHNVLIDDLYELNGGPAAQ